MEPSGQFHPSLFFLWRLISASRLRDRTFTSVLLRPFLDCQKFCSQGTVVFCKLRISRKSMCFDK